MKKLLSSLICQCCAFFLASTTLSIREFKPLWWSAWCRVPFPPTPPTPPPSGRRLGRFAAPPSPPSSLSQERPTYAEDRKAAEFHSRPSGALVQVLHGWNRCDLHTGHSWQHSDSEEAISRPVTFKSCPRAVRSQPNPPCCIPDTRYPFLATDLRLSLFPF